MGPPEKPPCVGPGGPARCSIRTGSSIPIITISIIIITLITTTIHLQVGDLIVPADDLHRGKDRVRAKLRIPAWTQRWLHQGRMEVTVTMKNHVPFSITDPPSLATAVMETPTQDSEITGSGSHSERSKTLLPVLTSEESQQSYSHSRAYQLIL
ncbi:unnamed protein product [Ophioblennius macclurei]